MKIAIAELGRLPQDGGVPVQVEGLALAVIRHAGEIFVIEDRCPHRDAPLHDAVCVGGEIICPWHKARFDLRTGKLLNEPQCADIKTYPVSIEGEQIFIQCE